MISAISWVPKGASKLLPTTADPPTKEEIEEIKKSLVSDKSRGSDSEENDGHMDFDADEKIDEVAQALAAAEALGKTPKDGKMATDEITLGLEELGMENYDDEDEGIELFGGVMGDVYYPSNDMDPYLKNDSDDDSEEAEDMTVNPTDSLIICARDGEEFSYLEVWLLEDSDNDKFNMYNLYEVTISKFPLCTAWLDCPLRGGERGNFIAVGSMEPSIEIWDLDVRDEMQPSLILGGIEEKKKKSKKKTTKYIEGSHTDSVLGLAWNKEYRNILASASADRTVKIWDMVAGKCNMTMEHHTDKVQAVAWNRHAPQILLSGSFDHSVVMKDGRMPTHSGYSWQVTADVESLAWDPHNEHFFVVSLEDGTVKGFDIRAATSKTSGENSTFTLHAHDKAVTTISYNPVAPNFLATGSTDKTVKLWDLTNNQPSCIGFKNPKAGAIFSISFADDRPSLLAIGGSKGNLHVWDTSELDGARKLGNAVNKDKPQEADS